MLMITAGVTVVSTAAGVVGGGMVAAEAGAEVWVGLVLGFLAAPMTVVVTHFLTRQKLAAQDVKVDDIKVHVDGHLSSLNERVEQLIQALEGSDTEVPADPNLQAPQFEERIEQLTDALEGSDTDVPPVEPQ